MYPGQTLVYIDIKYYRFWCHPTMKFELLIVVNKCLFSLGYVKPVFAWLVVEPTHLENMYNQISNRFQLLSMAHIVMYTGGKLFTNFVYKPSLMPWTKQTELSTGDATTVHLHYSNIANLKQPQPIHPRLIQENPVFFNNFPNRMIQHGHKLGRTCLDKSGIQSRIMS